MFVMKRVVQLMISLVCLSGMTHAVSLFTGPMLEKRLVHHAHMQASSVLHRHMEYQKLEILTLKTYTPRADFQGELFTTLGGVLSKSTHAPVGGSAAMALFFSDWLTGYVSVDSTRPRDKLFDRNNLDNVHLIIGNFLHFPWYLQLGLYSLPFGLHESDIFPRELLLTRQALYPYSFGGASVGFNYIIGTHHIQGNVFGFHPSDNKNDFNQQSIELFKISKVGAAAQYGIQSNTADILVGGSSYQSIAKDIQSGSNVYAHIQLGSKKLYYEYARANQGHAHHVEGSYHSTLYNLPSAWVIGGEKGSLFNKQFGDHIFHCYGFGGLKLEFIKCLTAVMGVKWNIEKYMHCTDNELLSNEPPPWYQSLSPILIVKFNVY